MTSGELMLIATDGRLVLCDFGGACLLFHGDRVAELELEFQERQRQQVLEAALVSAC